MPDPTTRTAADIEAELESIDNAAHDIALADDSPAGTTPPTKGEKPADREPDYEYEARRKGWRPEADYTGPAGKWVDAKTFLDRGERFTKKLESTIAQMQAKIDSFEGTKAQFRKFFDDQMAKRDREHAEAISALRIQRSEAIRSGDDALAIELEDRIDATKLQQKALQAEAKAAAAEKTAPAQEKLDPVLAEWIEDGNEWLTKDSVLQQHAIAVGKTLRDAGEKAQGRAFLEKVKAQVIDDFPRRFGAVPGDKPSSSDSSSSSSTTGRDTSRSGSASFKGKTERDLPPADLQLMRQFVKDGLYTKEQFLKSYFTRNG